MTSDPPPPEATPHAAAVTAGPELLRTTLDELGIAYRIDDRGRFITTWPGYHVVFTFSRTRSILCGRLIHGTAFSIADKGAVRDFIDEWHADSLWPKVYTMTDDNGLVSVVGEACMVVSGGVTPRQFRINISAWLDGMDCFHRFMTGRLALFKDLE